MTLPQKRTRGGSRFTCPHCGVFAQQTWTTLSTGDYPAYETLGMALCTACQQYSLWVTANMVWPNNADVALPNPDLQDDKADIIDDYLEAMSILNNSPRGAAALLRLCIQKLCVKLSLPGKDLNSDIGELVKRGLPPMVQQSLDSVRVIGNESVHPGQMDMKDDTDTARALFNLVNVIADSLISAPKQAEAIYQSLPQSKLDQIDERDSS